MSRSTKNVQVSELQNGTHREIPFNEAAQETYNARVNQLGPFRKANLAIDLSAVALTRGGVDADAPTSVLAHSDGVVVAIAYKFGANISAGGATAAQLQATLAPGNANTAAKGDLIAVASGGSAAQAAVVDLATPVAFKKGDALGVVISTSHTFAPTTDDVDVDLIVRYAASSGSPA